MSKLLTVPVTTPVDELIKIVELDGGVIIKDLLSKEQVDRLNADIDSKIEGIDLGGKTVHEDEHFADFFGNKTKRMTNLVTISKVFREEIIQNEKILDCVDAFFKPVADSALLATAQVIDIYPGQKPQPLHRDFEVYPYFRQFGAGAPEVLTNFLLALSEYTEEIGATRVIPKSHLWNDFSNRGSQDQTIAAEMEPGSALWISGKVVHGGGENKSPNRVRRGIAFAFNPNWLVPEEASAMIIPIEIAKTLPKRIQGMLGFRSVHNASMQGGSLWLSDYKELAEHLGLDSAD
ncbi:Ectoine hydroxylase-related dioxygenase, phytanoyl-CoA dioxygenase (PhyH) family [Paraburkholderia fungorum]|uniref:Ectoine hydroxylase-related dioxygenase, phytanoyl-CoA dioxygenase (PhyH) family n=2 Tax=Paraburkholderia fungorum TaxID=134537 RepID=A0A1H1JVY9_9BURK|nr:Ectoine hydroxylase-related dioxygenase, phytanoyl-CoA dioxygenase (PhyH) family [Paraburkholderia fungorum]